MKKKRKHGRLKNSGVNPQRFNRGQIKFYVYIIPVAVFMSLPIVFIVINAFKPIEELFAYPPRFFVKNPSLGNFRQLLSFSSESNIPISRYLFNSIISTLIVLVGTLLMSSTAGYILSKKRFKMKNILLSINNLALMFVATAVAIPRYFVVVFSGLQDNFLANVVPLLVMPVGLFLVKQFIDQIPDSLVEAAVIDGANDYRILSSIIIPLIKPALATVAILAFQISWNNTEASVFYLNKETLKTFSFYLTTLSNNSGNLVAGQGNASANIVAGQGMVAAASLIMFLPNLILFIILQSKVMNTMAHSGLK